MQDQNTLSASSESVSSRGYILHWVSVSITWRCDTRMTNIACVCVVLIAFGVGITLAQAAVGTVAYGVVKGLQDTELFDWLREDEDT